MALFLNSVLLNALVAAGVAFVVWGTGIVPAIHRRPGLRHALWVIVLHNLVTPPVFTVSILPAWLLIGSDPLTHPRAIPHDNLLAAMSIQASDIRIELPAATSRGASIDWIWLAVVGSGFGTLTVLAFAMGQLSR